MFGTVTDDMESEAAFFSNFDDLFGGGFDMFDDFDAFAHILESDNKFMKHIFKDLGGSYRNRGGKRRKH
jgi:hypothetical protein